MVNDGAKCNKCAYACVDEMYDYVSMEKKYPEKQVPGS
jgi:hypothetical protein